MGEVRSVVIDTTTSVQENQFMSDKKKATHDKWKDYGQELFMFYLALQELGFEVVLIIGQPGTGKSSGMRTLDPKTNIWFNIDNKNPVWSGGRAEYGKKTNPKMPYHMIPTSYKQILDHIKEGLKKGMFVEDRVCFFLGHIETFKEGIDVKSRLKTLGNLTTKMQLEGRMEHCFYSFVKMVEGKPNYLLMTHNDGYNTARSPQGLFEPEIPNDYKLILDKVTSDY